MIKKWENKTIQGYDDKINDIKIIMYEGKKIKWYKDSSRSMLVRGIFLNPCEENEIIQR